MVNLLQRTVSGLSTELKIVRIRPLFRGKLPVQINRYELESSNLPGGVAISPQIVLATVPDIRTAKLLYSGNLRAHLEKLTEHGLFRLDPKLNYAGDTLFNGKIAPGIWFNNVSTSELFQRIIGKNGTASLVIASNAGNAPLHDWEIDYVHEGNEQIIGSKDQYVGGRPINKRSYFCVTFHPDRGIAIEYVKFSDNGGTIIPPDLKAAIGGRPLVYNGNPSALSEVLKTSVTDPRHVLLLPEMEVTGNMENPTFLPIGLRTVQRMIGESRHQDIIERIKAGEPILISLEEEADCLGPLGVQRTNLMRALSMFGYREDEYSFGDHSLYFKIRLNSYRHTFWAQKGNTIFIGIITNDLKGPAPYDGTFYNRVLKSFGLTIPQLQLFITEELEAENAVLMGNGKDPRIFVHPPLPEIENPIADNDIRDSITAGLISLIL